MAIIIVQGFAPTNKVPGFKANTIFASGRSSGSLFRRTVLLVGLLGTGATAAVNTVLDIFADTDADQFGPRSELARMCRVARRYPDAKVKAIAVAAAGGAASATATITIGGTWTRNWAFAYRMGRVRVTGTIALTDTPTQAAAKIRDAFNAQPHGPATAASTGAVVTLMIDSPGVRGNQYALAQDTSDLPSTATSVLAGGTAWTGGIVPFTGGTGTETYTSLLATIATAQYDRIGLAANDAASLGAWRDHVRAQAGALVGNLEAFVTATNDTLTSAQSLATTTLNEPRANLLWFLNSETHPSELAASFAAVRATTEEANPSPRYMNVELRGVAPQSQRPDWPIETVRDAALNAGVTPVMTTEDGLAVVNRGITTYCRLSGAPDERVLDINQQSFPDYWRETAKQIWDTELAPEYERVRPDPGPNDDEPPAGVLYPKLLKARFQGELRRCEANGWCIDVDANPPVVLYDATGRRLMAETPVVPTPLNYQLGLNIRQRSA